jgi:glutamine synthetase
MTDLLYTIPPHQHSPNHLRQLLEQHREVKFVSLMGIDLGGNATDEKIPITRLLEDMEGFLSHGVQTDGSSVALHGIATLNDARIDMLPDPDVNWYIDYNLDHLGPEGNAIGTLKIPAMLLHNGRKVDSRSTLIRAIESLETNLTALFQEHPTTLVNAGIDSVHQIEKLIVTAATELEFWVQTPREIADIEKLATSQTLKEQYWKRTRGAVRTALEESLLVMDRYGLDPEMGHKEVGGFTSEMGGNGQHDHVMEQLEIDWRYSSALQAADNDILVREIVSDVFHRYGLEITFSAKPFAGVAGNGKHTHLGLAVKLRDGSMRNLFSPLEMEKDFLSPIGYGALMGLLKNYEVVNPFVTASNDALNRLKPGFEAPVCTVASLGHSVDNATRNRSILVGLVRDPGTPMATRFELRSPNPLSNTWLVLSAACMAMLDGIMAAVNSGKTARELEAETSKPAGQESFYLETDRAYRSEEDVFEHYAENNRNRLFGTPPATVWENASNLEKYPEKVAVLLRDGVFAPDIITGYKLSILDRWVAELLGRVIPTNLNIVRQCRQLPGHDDTGLWQRIHGLRLDLAKDTPDSPSLFTRIRMAVAAQDYALASSLQLEQSAKITSLRELYLQYTRNILD